MRWIKQLWVWVGIGVMLVACGGNATESVSTVTPSVKPILRFHNWDTYIDPQIITDFEEMYGVTVDYTIFDTDEDMVDELRQGAAYDLVVPSDFIVQILREADLLQQLDLEKIPNVTHLDTRFRQLSYDPGNRYCVPYQWGTVGLGYNIEATGREILSWDDILDEAYSGRVAFLDDYRTSLGVVLIALGYSPNTTDANEVLAAQEWLQTNKTHIGAYTGDDAQDLLAAGEYDIVVEWSGDIFQVMEDNPAIRYVIPTEGSIIWTDNICVPTTAENPELAYQFINYLLEPAVGAQLSTYVQYGSPNKESIPLLAAEDRDNRAIYPSDEVRNRLFYLYDVNSDIDAVYQQAWADILSDHFQR